MFRWIGRVIKWLVSPITNTLYRWYLEDRAKRGEAEAARMLEKWELDCSYAADLEIVWEHREKVFRASKEFLAEPLVLAASAHRGLAALPYLWLVAKMELLTPEEVRARREAILRAQETPKAACKAALALYGEHQVPVSVIQSIVEMDKDGTQRSWYTYAALVPRTQEAWDDLLHLLASYGCFQALHEAHASKKMPIPEALLRQCFAAAIERSSSYKDLASMVILLKDWERAMDLVESFCEDGKSAAHQQAARLLLAMYDHDQLVLVTQPSVPT